MLISEDMNSSVLSPRLSILAFVEQPNEEIEDFELKPVLHRLKMDFVSKTTRGVGIG